MFLKAIKTEEKIKILIICFINFNNKLYYERFQNEFKIFIYLI